MTPFMNALLVRLRQPEYTGENRCTPCTILNVAIALVASAALAFLSPWLAPFVLGLSLAAIYLRGYLVPGTPTLTKRYFPERVLRWFDKQPVESVVDGETTVRPEPDGPVDLEDALRDAGVLVDCETEDDLCLDTEFRKAWFDRIETLRLESNAMTELARTLTEPESGAALEETLTGEETDTGFAVRDGGITLGNWESRAALMADVAADRELEARANGWTDATVEERFGLVRGLRVFLDRCPVCGGTVTTAENIVESCCYSRSVLATACEDCGTRLAEIDL